METVRYLTPILCSVPVAYLAFIDNFKKDLKNQLQDLIKGSDSPSYSKGIRIDYIFFAFILFKINNKNWRDVFVSRTKIAERLEYDKSAAVRALIWSCFSFLGFILLVVIK